jgi:hypothetical protein
MRSATVSRRCRPPRRPETAARAGRLAETIGSTSPRSAADLADLDPLALSPLTFRRFRERYQEIQQ